MREVFLSRVKLTSTYTRGVIDVENEAPFSVLELPWRNNEVERSCIPAGTYILEQFFHKEWGITWFFQHVPGRTDVILHWGNFLKDTRGCPLIATFFSIEPTPRVGASKQAFLRFRNALRSEKKFMMHILEPKVVDLHR